MGLKKGLPVVVEAGEVWFPTRNTLLIFPCYSTADQLSEILLHLENCLGIVPELLRTMCQIFGKKKK